MGKCGWLSIGKEEFYSTILLTQELGSTNLPRNLYAASVVPHEEATRAATQRGIMLGVNYAGPGCEKFQMLVIIHLEYS
jgi:hypothetical protein